VHTPQAGKGWTILLFVGWRRDGGKEIGQLPNKIPVEQKLLKKFVQWEPSEKIEQVFSTVVVIISFEILPTTKIMHNLKVRKTFHAPENCPTPPPPTPEK